MKMLDDIKSQAYRRRHFYKLSPVVVDGMRYNVMSVTPQHTEEIPKKVKDILKYLVNKK